MSRKHRFTIYDMMEAKGVFESNPANRDSRDQTTGESLFTGAIEYPKMLYHPTGETKIIREAEMIETPMGPKFVGEQRELVWQIVNSKADEAKLKAEGWHDHPAKSIAAGGREAPPMSSIERLDDLQREIERLQAELAKVSESTPKGSNQDESKPLPAGVTKAKVA